MRKLAILLLSIFPALVLGQGVTNQPPWGGSGGKVLASFPLSSNGGLIAEDANTVAHVYWNGSALVDTKGNSWTQQGTVPQVAATPGPFVPGKAGSGPYSTGKSYTLGSGSDVLDFTGDFTICLVVKGPFLGTGVPFGNGNNAATGYYFVTYADNHFAFVVSKSGTYVSTGTPAGTLSSGLNVLCSGRSADNFYSKANAGTTYTYSMAGYLPGTPDTARIGDYSGGGIPYDAFIYEVYATSTPWNEAAVTAIQQKVLGHYDGTAPISVTRTTQAWSIPRAADCASGTCLYASAPGVARITENGLLVEPQRTNSVLHSNDIRTTWTTSNVSEADGGSSPFTGNWDQITSTTNVGYVSQPTTTASSTTFVASAWVAKASGTGAAAVLMTCSSSLSVCACARSDGGACTAEATLNAKTCGAKVFNLGTTPVRLSAVVTCGTAITDPTILLIPGEYSVATGTTRFSGAQLEVGTYPTSLIVTTTTSVQRNADQVSATVPAVGPKWCVAGTYKPEEGRSWSATGTRYPWALGSFFAANTAAAYETGGAMFFETGDSSAVSKYTTIGTMSGTVPRLVFCDSLGTLAISKDGVLASGASGNAGTGLWSASPTTIYLGTIAAGTNQFAGFIKNIRLCNAKSWRDCK